MRRRHGLTYTAQTSVVSQSNEPDISTKHRNFSLKSNPNISPSISNRSYKRFPSRFSTLIDGIPNLQWRCTDSSELASSESHPLSFEAFVKSSLVPTGTNPLKCIHIYENILWSMYTYMCIVYSDVRDEILLKLYNIMAAPTFVYGCENWNLIKQEEGKVRKWRWKCEASWRKYIVWQ